MILLRVFAWLLVLILIIATVVPAAERPVTGIGHGYEHLLSFAFVGAVFALAYPWRLIVLLPLAVAFAGLLEIIQIPLPTRHARLTDFVVDALASCLGIALSSRMLAFQRDRSTDKA